MVNITTAAETLPQPIVPETISPVQTGSFIPAEPPEAILGLIPDELTAKEARPVIEKIATADVPKGKTTEKTEPADAPPTDKPKPEDDKPTENSKPDDPAKEATQKAERELVKQQLKEIGVVLLRTHDVRAPLVALSLAAGDTPIGDEFRKQTLTMILDGAKLESMTDADWKTRQDTLPKDTGDTSALETFFINHGYPKDLFKQYKKELAGGIQDVMNQTDKDGNPTPTATDLKTALGWTSEHPMPKTPEALGTYISNDAKNAEDMEKIFSKIQWENGVKHFKDGLKSVVQKAPNYLYFSLMAVNMLNQFAQETEGPKTAH